MFLNRPEARAAALLALALNSCKAELPSIPVEVRPTPVKVEVDLQGVTQHKYRTTGQYQAPGFPNITYSEEQETRNPYPPDCAQEILIDSKTGEPKGREHLWKRLPGINPATVVAKLVANSCHPEKIGLKDFLEYSFYI